MDQTTERLSRSIWVGIGLVIVLLSITFVLSRVKAPPPKKLPVLGSVADFALTNQNNQPVTLADLRGKVWLADIIFTSCAGPCPRMTKQMEQIQEALPKTSSARLVTLTTDPENDSPEALRKYAERFKADPARWLFLTGEKAQIAALGIDSLKLTAVEIKPEERKNPADLFIHSTIFVLVDKQARLRGIFETDAEGVEWEKIRQKIVAAMAQLEREP